MQDFVIVTLNPTSTMDFKHKIVAVSRPRIEECDGKQFIKIEGMIVDAAFTYEEAVNVVTDKQRVF